MGVTRSSRRSAQRSLSGHGPGRLHLRHVTVTAVFLLAAVVMGACGTTVPEGERNLAAGRSNAQGLGAASGFEAGETSSTVVGDQPADASLPSGSAEGASSPNAVGTPTTAGIGSGAAPAIPTEGPGWDAKNIYIGVTTAKNKEQAASAAGASGVYPGDNEAQANAVAKYYNDRGGLFGRKIVIRFDDHDFAKMLSQPDAESNAVCTRFTQDLHVVAVVNPEGGLDTPNLRACLSKAGIPLFSGPAWPIDDQTLRENKGMYFVTSGAPNWSRYASALVDRLVAQGYFNGWDTAKGGPGSAPVRVGIIGQNDPTSVRAFGLLEAALKRAGHGDNIVTFQYSNFAADANSEVLKMRSNNVTHVIALDAGLFTFATAAESQRYRPRYGVHSNVALVSVMEGTVPAAQNVGAVGLGTIPTYDNRSQSGEITPGGKLCHDIMTANGQNFGGKRYAESYALMLCDSIRLIVEGAMASQGLTGQAIAAGVGKIGPGFAPSITFASGLTPSHQVLAAAGLDVQYQTSCSCYQYVDRTLRRF